MSTIRLVESTPLPEATVGSSKGRRFRARLIEGDIWGSSGYYSREVLERDGPTTWPQGTPVYLDHPSESEERDRPERSVRDLAGKTTSTPAYETDGLYSDVEIYPHVAPVVEAMADDIGLSIRAAAEVDEGEAAGRRGTIVNRLIEGLSVDLVTRTGAGGKLVALLESARKRLEEAVSDTAWSEFSASDYDAAQWRRACLIDTGEGDEDSKARYRLPVREPDGTVNRNGCHAAASVLAGGRGGVAVGADVKKAAAKKLVGLYRSQLEEDPPESLLKAAGMATSESATSGGSSAFGSHLTAAGGAEGVTVTVNGHTTTGATITFDPPLSIEARRAAVRRIFWEASANDTERALQDAVSAAYSDTENDTYAWMRDYDPDKTLVYFEVSVGGKTTIYQQTYTAGEDGTYELTGDRTEVTIHTQYVPVDPAGQSTTTEESEEDPMTTPVEEARLRQLEEDAGRVQTLESERDTAREKLTDAERDRDTARDELTQVKRELAVEKARVAARDLAVKRVREANSELPPAAAEKVITEALRDIPLGEDERLDTEKFSTRVDEARKAEETYLTSIVESGAGRVRGLGDTGSTQEITEADNAKLIAETFGRKIEVA